MSDLRGSDLIEDAIATAVIAHEGQLRKGTDIPYVAHPVAVGIILSRLGADEEVIAAGILHDTVEDTDITVADLRRDFGPRVTELVVGASEMDKSLPWEQRKKDKIHSLKSASLDVRIVVAADKLHNLRSTRREFEAVGPAVWNRFSRGPDQQEWYYCNVLESLGFSGTSPMLDALLAELQVEILQLFA